jgi:carbamoyltransferase
VFVLGVHGTFGRSDLDTSAALVSDGRIVAAAEEERFSRNKHATGVMPEQAIRYCLAEAGIGLADVDCVAFPRTTWGDVEPRLKAFFDYRFGCCPDIRMVHHHLAHAASAFYVSGEESALVVTVDMSGDGVSLGVYRGDGLRLTCVHEEPYPNSLGLFAAMMTQHLGFRSNNGEYKVMGLAAYGEPSIDLNWLLEVDSSGYRFHDEFLHAEKRSRYPLFHTEQLPMVGAEAARRLPRGRMDDEGFTHEHADLAASVQLAIEEAVLAVVKRFRSPDDAVLCLAGGVSNNSVSNGRIAASGLFDRVYVPPAPGDAGTALGAALAVAAGRGHRFAELRSSLLGPGYSDAAIADALDRWGVDYRRVSDPAAEAARLLAEDRVVGWFQGRSEFGPRALGGRSLLANPTRPETQDRMNAIKGREEFRPLAPSILADAAGDYFDVVVDAPFMSFTLPVSARGQELLPAAVHVDGSSRPQLVERGSGLYARMIERFQDETGIPAVLNTSFNVGPFPIVQTPKDALACFFTSPIDALVAGRCVVEKIVPAGTHAPSALAELQA